MTTERERPDGEEPRRNALEPVSVEPDFDYSWLSKAPPGYEDVDEDGQVIAPGSQPTSDDA